MIQTLKGTTLISNIKLFIYYLQILFIKTHKHRHMYTCTHMNIYNGSGDFSKDILKKYEIYSTLESIRLYYYTQKHIATLCLTFNNNYKKKKKKGFETTP